MLEEARSDLLRAARAARRRLFLSATADAYLRAAPGGLIVAAAVAAADLRWGQGTWVGPAAALGIAVPAVIALVYGVLHLAGVFQAATALDHRGGLKDRVASALEFMRSPLPDGPHRAQIVDAADHARSVRARSVIRLASPRRAVGVAAGCALLLLSLLTPPRSPEPASAEPASTVHAAQLEELRALREALEMQTDDPDETMQAALERLKALEERVAAGDTEPRDALIELARLEEALQAGAARLGAEALEQELDTVAPHWMAAEATRPAAMAVREGDLQAAAERMRAVASEMREGRLSAASAEQAAGQMRIAAGKIGDRSGSRDSFAADLQQAAEALTQGDADAMAQAGEGVGEKLERVAGARRFREMSRRVAAGRTAMGQAGRRRETASAARDGAPGSSRDAGSADGQGQDADGRGDLRADGRHGEGGGQGGLEAGTGAGGDPFGDPRRLEESLRRIIEVAGAMGQGPVESRVESTEGSLSDSEVDVRDVVGDYAAVAEEAIAQEHIPLSHRFHVKRYFEQIRPPG